MNQRILRLAAAAFTFTACAPREPAPERAPDARPAVGRLPAAGASWTNEVAVEQTVVQTIGGRDIESRLFFCMNYRFRLIGRESDGSVAMEAGFERLAIRATSPVGDFSFDSASPAGASPTLAPLAALAGATFRFRLGQDLKVSGIGGLEVLAARIAAAARDPSLAASASSFVNETSIRQSLESIFCFFPTGEVAPGDIWKAESTLGGQAPSVTRYVFTDVKNERGRLTEKVEGRVEPAQAGGGANLRGAISGEVEVDADALRVLAGSIDQELSGIIVVHGVSMPMEVKTLTTFK